ncbi:MAG: hypothetical protein ACUVRV_02780 [Cyanobacteriota bacterium]
MSKQSHSLGWAARLTPKVVTSTVGKLLKRCGLLAWALPALSFLLAFALYPVGYMLVIDCLRWIHTASAAVGDPSGLWLSLSTGPLGKWVGTGIIGDPTIPADCVALPLLFEDAGSALIG